MIHNGRVRINFIPTLPIVVIHVDHDGRVLVSHRQLLVAHHPGSVESLHRLSVDFPKPAIAFYDGSNGHFWNNGHSGITRSQPTRTLPTYAMTILPRLLDTRPKADELVKLILSDLSFDSSENLEHPGTVQVFRLDPHLESYDRILLTVNGYSGTGGGRNLGMRAIL